MKILEVKNLCKTYGKGDTMIMFLFLLKKGSLLQ